MQQGYWDKEKFEYKMSLEIASYDYEIQEDELHEQFIKAKSFAEENGHSADAVEIWDIFAGKKIFLFETEDVTQLIKGSQSEEFLIYMETTGDFFVVCTGGIRSVPKSEFPETGDAKKFNKESLLQGYTSAIHDFENLYNREGLIKLHIYSILNS